MKHFPVVAIGALVVMIALIVVLDVTLLRGHLVPRLIVNVAIVVGFAVAYFSLRRRRS